MTRRLSPGRKAILAAFLAATALAGCAAPSYTETSAGFGPIGGGSATASMPVAQAAPPASVQPPVARVATSSNPTGVGVQAQIAAFRDICGLVARTGGIAAAREAALSRGFRPVGTSGGHAYGFSNFAVLGNDQGMQVQLSDSPGFGTLTSREVLCSIVTQDSGGSRSVFDAAASTLAADAGATLEPRGLGGFGLDEFGKSQFRVAGRIARMDWQDRPFGLVLYTIRG